MQETLLSGNASFNIEVPYKIIETGKSGEKSLIVYLHGFNQNIKQFGELVEDLLSLEAYHLFIQGPYPIYDRRRQKKVKDWGRAWYLYDGEQDQFIKSLELSAEFIQDVIGKILKQITVSRIAVLGYSMGGYQAGYFALSRRNYVNDLIVIGGRIKTEVFENQEVRYEYLSILALHGSEDESVKSDPQKESCEQLARWGAEVTFNELNEAHSLDGLFISTTLQWLISQGYS